MQEIYRIELKYGMELAAISSVDRIFSDEDIAKVTEQALLNQEKQQSETLEAAAMEIAGYWTRIVRFLLRHSR